MRIYLIYICILFNVVFLKNLTLHDYDNPSANHILDSTIPYDNSDLLIVVGMLGGIEFYDISNPEILNHLNNLQLTGGGGGQGGGGGTKPNCIVALNDYAYVTTNRGLGIIDISNPSNPEYLGIVSGTNNYILEDLDVNSNFLAVAAHENGTLLFDITNPEAPNFLTSIEGQNVWTVNLSNDYLYIGDQSTLNIHMIITDFFDSFVDVVDVSNIILSNSIKDIETSHYNDYIFVALGSDGVVMIDYNNEDFTYDILGEYDTSALANKIDFFDDSIFLHRLAVSDWDDVEVLEWDGNNLNLVGYKNTTRRTMGVATKGDFIYSAEWSSVQVFEYGEIDGPDIDLSAYELNYPYVNNGESYTMSLDVTNNGNSLLNIIDAYTTNNEFSYSILNDLYPGETQTIDISYEADAVNASGSYRIYSNDPDENEIICETNGNINGANIGDAAPDFTLPIIANDTGMFSLSNQLGKVVVIAFFAPN